MCVENARGGDKKPEVTEVPVRMLWKMGGTMNDDFLGKQQLRCVDPRQLRMSGNGS